MPFCTETDRSPREPRVALIVPAAHGEIPTRPLDTGVIGEWEGTTALGGALGHELRHELRHPASDTRFFRPVGWRAGHTRLWGGWPVGASAICGHASARQYRVVNLQTRVEQPASKPASEQPETW